jgi:pimeloyl-ACP methyl ester carboxylesterase
VWHPLFGQLPHWRCISIDHRGTGASTRSGPITVEDLASDLLAVADAWGVGPCLLAAESSGAAAALRAVRQAPRRFLGLVLVGAAWQPTPAGSSDPFIGALRRDYHGTLRNFIDQCLPETDSLDLRRWALQMAIRSDLDDAVDLLRSREFGASTGPAPPPATASANPAHPVTAPIGNGALRLHPSALPLPTLLIHGARDRIVSSQASRDLAAMSRQAELHVLPGLGHVPIVTDPARVAGLIDNFGARLSLLA